MPPITVITNASIKTATPISGMTPRIGAARKPAMPAMAVPRAKMRSQTFEVSMPSTFTISESRAPARTISPNGVFSMKSQSATNIAAVNPMTKSRYRGNEMSPRNMLPLREAGALKGIPSVPNNIRISSTTT